MTGHTGIRAVRPGGAVGADTRPVVVFEYSQTGQLTEVADALVAPLEAAGRPVRRVRYAPAEPYPFPWPVARFFGVFPSATDESARVALTVDPSELYTGPDELVILAYQVWYLAPSVPVRSLLAAHPELFAGRDVVTLVACRNMWYSAAAEVRRTLTAAGAAAVGTVAAIDTRPQGITLVTTLRWLLLGSRDGFLGRAGVGADELRRVGAVGERLAAATGPDETAQALAGAAPVVPVLAAADLVAGQVFRRAGAVIRPARGAARAAGLLGFALTLGVAIVTGLPALVAARLLLGKRFDRVVQARLTGVGAAASAGAAR
ncbi:hypothetical protein [Nocardia asteroides]|uniref:hypothetical protein n=1 Tax=Nocardia asteroides TaxID=1824 RepID=UPI001E52FAE5|nr:hypothetical protein [Nocardia asteroides]UGT62324.1 hypothetical protein LTT61_02965 [Nocardia asteroides]